MSEPARVLEFRLPGDGRLRVWVVGGLELAFSVWPAGGEFLTGAWSRDQGWACAVHEQEGGPEKRSALAHTARDVLEDYLDEEVCRAVLDVVAVPQHLVSILRSSS